MHKFKVGDEVIMNELANSIHFYTKADSEGKILKIENNGNAVSIQFYKVTGHIGGIKLPSIFTVNMECVELLNKDEVFYE